MIPLYVAVDYDGTESIFEEKPKRCGNDLPMWDNEYGCSFIVLPKGSIEKLIGRQITWDDEPVQL